MSKEPIKTKLVKPKRQSLTLGQNYTERKSMMVNVGLEKFVRNALKENRLQKRSQLFDNKS